MMRCRRLKRRETCLALLWTATLILPLSGCSVLGLAGSAVTRTVVKPTYARLAGQSVAIMVATDRGTQIEFPRLQLDIAQDLTARMQGAQQNKADELKGTTFPDSASPNVIFAFQKNFPQHEFDPITDTAPKFGVLRLIYIEIDSFSLNPSDVVELFRGEISGTMRVLEVTAGKAKVAYTERVTAHFPDQSPAEGRLDLNRSTTYRGSRNAFNVEVMKRFVAYEQ